MQSLENKQLDVVKQLTTCVQGECKPSEFTPDSTPAAKDLLLMATPSDRSDHTMFDGSAL